MYQKQETAVSEVRSGCAVRAAIQQEKAWPSEEDRHYLGAIRARLNALYKMTTAPNVREQISDEISWVIEKLGEPTPVPLIDQAQDIERLRAAMKEACDLLAERTYGSAARSPGHNARLCLESALEQR